MKLDVRQMEIVKHRTGFTGCLTISSLDKKGGLALMWRNEMNVEVWNYS